MATYTMTLEEALEFSGGTHDLIDGKTVITGGNIGLDHYPIFDETYRADLNAKIFDHYRHEEIGTETLSMFQWHMRKRMNEIMPYFNKLYVLELLDIDPLSTVDLETTMEGLAASEASSESERTGISTSEMVADNDITRTSNSETESAATNASESGSGSRNVASTTPQVMLSGSGDYASNATDTTGKVTVEAESSETSLNNVVDNSEESLTQTNNVEDNVQDVGTQHSTTESETVSKTKGYQGLASDLIAKHRENIINIDMLVIESLQNLFMLVWGTNDAYVENRNFYF